jgi:3-oxoacyl-[acyl-carrier-protein] synthase-3
MQVDSSVTAVIAGIGAFVPSSIVTNDMLSAELDTTDAWIRTRTGIHERRVVDPGVCTSDLAVAAGRNACISAGLSRVDAVVLATTTPDQSCPGTAPAVASRLGLTGVPAFDLNAACSGFVYGLTTAAALIGAGVVSTVLLIGADCFTTTLDPADRTTRALIGDGAGAMVLRAGDRDERGALLGYDLGSDGAGTDLLVVPGTGSRQRSSGRHPEQGDTYFQMRGREVFEHAVTRMAGSVELLLERVGWRAEDIVLAPHQANLRILAAVAEQLELAEFQLVSNIARFGNTVSASIPLALIDASRHGQVKPGCRVMTTAFGAGLTWGSVALVWPDTEPVSNQ